MSLIVQKYGGSSAANAEKIKNIARRVIATKEKGSKVVVVISAMGEERVRFFALHGGDCLQYAACHGVESLWP
jgi:aspartokinase